MTTPTGAHRKIAGEIVETWGNKGGMSQDWPGITLEDAIAQALVDAEARGLKKAVKLIEQRYRVTDIVNRRELTNSILVLI